MASSPVETNRVRLGVEVLPPVARLTLHNPPLNVIDVPMMEELAASLAEIEVRQDITIIALSGKGRAFSAGVDIAAHTSDKITEMLTKFHAIVRALIATKKVTVSAVHGLCLGGGAELAMVCDVVLTTEDAEWGFPEIKLACFPPVACAALAALIGQKKAAELILTGRSVTGREAAEVGLATRSVSESQLDSAVHACVGQLSRLSPAALAIAKKACYAWDSMHFDKGLARAEKIYFEDLINTADAQEGVHAFLEKRQPKWTGK